MQKYERYKHKTNFHVPKTWLTLILFLEFVLLIVPCHNWQTSYLGQVSLSSTKIKQKEICQEKMWNFIENINFIIGTRILKTLDSLPTGPSNYNETFLLSPKIFLIVYCSLNIFLAVYSQSSRKLTPSGREKSVRNWRWPLTRMVLLNGH